MGRATKELPPTDYFSREISTTAYHDQIVVDLAAALGVTYSEAQRKINDEWKKKAEAADLWPELRAMGQVVEEMRKPGVQVPRSTVDALDQAVVRMRCILATR